MYNTPYHKRLAHRLALSKQRRGNKAANIYLEIDRFMLAFEQAYRDYYQIPLKVCYRHGWYYINNHPYRHSAVEEWTNTLLAKIQELDSPKPNEKE